MSGKDKDYAPIKPVYPPEAQGQPLGQNSTDKLAGALGKEVAKDQKRKDWSRFLQNFAESPFSPTRYDRVGSWWFYAVVMLAAIAGIVYLANK